MAPHLFPSRRRSARVAADAAVQGTDASSRRATLRSHAGHTSSASASSFPASAQRITKPSSRRAIRPPTREVPASARNVTHCEKLTSYASLPLEIQEQIMEYTLQEAYDQLLEPFTDKDSWDHMEKCEIKSAIRVFRHYIETLVGVVSRPELGGGGGLAHALKKLNEQATKDERQWTDDQDDEEWITPFKGTLPEWRQGRGKMIRSAPRLSLLKTLDGDIKANLMTGEVLRMVKAEIAIALVLLE